MRRHVFIFIAGLATAATVSLWPFAACAQQDASVQGLLNRILRMQAEDAAAKIGQFIHEIEVQMEWVAQSPSAGSLAQMVRHVPAITEATLIDAAREPVMMVKISRRADGLATSPADGPPDQNLTIGFNAIDAAGRSLIEFSETLGKKTHYGPVYFRREWRPLITLTFPMSHGVNVVEIDLKPIQDMLSQIKVSEHGQANVIDAQGRLIFPGLSLRLDNTNVTQFAQVRAAHRASGTGSGPVQSAKDILGRELLTAYAAVAPLGWLVFVELPIEEANALAE
jgi:two-component system, NtrC family, sensor kinase